MKCNARSSPTSYSNKETLLKSLSLHFIDTNAIFRSNNNLRGSVVKKTIISTSLVIASIVVLYKSGVLGSLILFILAGIIPGTKYAVPSTLMLLIMTCAAWVLVFQLLPFDFRHGTPQPKKTGPKRQLPKRRYERI